jgi:hypothetical protein
MWNRKPTKADRSERWKREDAAPRLATEVPSVKTLALVLKDSRGLQGVSGTERTQHVIVDRAAALFEVACADPKCEDGGHDLTHEVISALKRRQEQFEGTSECRGSVGGAPCRCTLNYRATATYSA